jgi:plasmid stabilization system protein ParE
MAYKVIIQERAERDIWDAFNYIYERAPDAAVPWYRRLKSDIQGLTDMPTRCVAIPDSEKLSMDLRQLIFGKRSGRYRIVFRIIEGQREVHVLTVRHGARKPLEPQDIISEGDSED